MKKYTGLICVSVLVLLAVILRTYHLASLPIETHIDEAGLGLNAWSIAHFGTDRHGNFLPVCPSNFYSEQSAFYTYFCALLVKFWGLNPYTLRIPAVVMGLLACFFGSLLMKEKWGKRGLFTGLILLSIFPWLIMNSRFALDCNAMLGAAAIALCCLLRLLKQIESEPEKKRYGQFAFVGVLFGIVLYTYIIAAIAVALFCILFGLFYLFQKKEERKIRFFRLFALALPLIVMAIPPVLVACVNYFQWESIITPFFSIPKTTGDRIGDISLSLSAFPGKLRALLHLLTSDGKFASSDRFWTMYCCSVPFVLLGGFFSLRDAVMDYKAGKIGADICMIFWTFSEVVLFLLCGQYNYHINGIFVTLSYFCVSGILSVAVFFKSAKVQLLYGVCLFCIYAASFAGFCLEYYDSSPSSAYQVYGGVDEALRLLTDKQKQGDIYVFDEVGEIYFLSNPIPPAEFLAACDESGYIRDYRSLHFHEPETYLESDVYICNKSSGRFYFFSDPALLGHECAVLETEYYYVFYPEGG